MSLFTLKAYMHHLWTARRWSTFHSPYLYELFSYCCNEKNIFPGFAQIENWRNELKASKQPIERNDFGAGSAAGNRAQTVQGIAKRALSLPFQCRFISRLCHFTKVNVALEFGTCLGISAAYMHAGSPDARIVTVEGDSSLAKLAIEGFKKLPVRNVDVIQSTFENFLKTNPTGDTKFDFIFLDGNHCSTPLLTYYDQLKKHMHEHTILMVDDIYWSADMHSGWQKLINKKEVTQSVDCFHFGLLFFNKEFLAKDNHVIRLPWKSLAG